MTEKKKKHCEKAWCAFCAHILFNIILGYYYKNVFLDVWFFFMFSMWILTKQVNRKDQFGHYREIYVYVLRYVYLKHLHDKKRPYIYCKTQQEKQQCQQEKQQQLMHHSLGFKGGWQKSNPFDIQSVLFCKV